MTERNLNMEICNLICRFGKEKVLLDLADELVLPSFTDTTLVRKYFKTSYFFHEVNPVMLEVNDSEKVIGIAGRFIKDTTLEREQIFEQGKGLVKDTGSMRSSPSSLFLLVLNCHRLIYVRETKDAPTKETFRSTLLSFLREKHKSHINSEFNKLNQQEDDVDDKKITKNDLLELYPKPTLELISLTSEDSIEEFIRKYTILSTVEISLSDRNDENDNDPFFDELQKRKDSIESIKSTVKHTNIKGLNKNSAIKEIVEATAQGNQTVKLKGIDSEGDSLDGNNEKFQLKKSLSNLSNLPQVAAKDLYKSFSGLVDDGLVKIPATSRKAVKIINSLAQKLF